MPQVWLQTVFRRDNDNHPHIVQSPEGMVISSNYFRAVDSEFPQLSSNKRLLKGTWHCWAKGPAAGRQRANFHIIIPMWTHGARPSSLSSNSTKCWLISEGGVKFPLKSIWFLTWPEEWLWPDDRLGICRSAADVWHSECFVRLCNGTAW